MLRMNLLLHIVNGYLMTNLRIRMKKNRKIKDKRKEKLFKIKNQQKRKKLKNKKSKLMKAKEAW